jgi:hypothetical protein
MTPVLQRRTPRAPPFNKLEPKLEVHPISDTSVCSNRTEVERNFICMTSLPRFPFRRSNTRQQYVISLSLVLSRNLWDPRRRHRPDVRNLVTAASGNILTPLL